jgi:hypothetical protein
MNANVGDKPTAEARRLVAAGKRAEAEAIVARLISDNFDMAVAKIAINADWSSLNSLNGIVDVADGRRFFFKFHQEEGEEATVEEYYRAELLQRAGLPVDMPVMICRRPGHQILLYTFRSDRQLATLCLAIERREDDAETSRVARLEADLNQLTGRIYIETLHESNAELARKEAIHQLFHNRLVSPDVPRKVGGRVDRFYAGQTMALPGAELSFAEFADRHWTVNGVEYPSTLAQLFEESRRVLDPGQLGASGAVVAHGDAHNANVWVEERGEAARLVLFDPAFAGEHVPALLADVKATFHNVFAHPLWLYHPGEADGRYEVTVAVTDKRIEVVHDWKLTPLRQAFLDAKIEFIWRPLLNTLATRGLLPVNWERIVRLALFCCPTLVMNLRAGASHGATAGRSPAIAALSFAIAVMAGCAPAAGDDTFSRFLAAVAPR